MPAPRTIEEFLAIGQQSGVLSQEMLQRYLETCQGKEGAPATPGALGQALVQNGVLTRFQAELLLQGKWRSFVVAGKYKVLDQLGSGGMGQVYLCEHMSLRRLVALKVLPSAYLDHPAALERFSREARLTAALDHPNIVRAHDSGREGNVHYLVMEYVAGATLQDLLHRTGPLDHVRAAHYISQAAEGLQYASEAGLVHRDIKPANLLLDRRGVVKILDLGLARCTGSWEDAITRKYDSGAVLGTADFLAPEQALNSSEVDIRADIYSLGMTFYFLLAGKSPFADGKSVAQKLICHQTLAPRPIREIRPDVPEAMARVLDRMTAKAPEARYQRPADIVAALAPWTQTPPAPPTEEELGARAVPGPLSRGPAPSRAGTTETFNLQTQQTVPPQPVRRSGSGSRGRQARRPRRRLALTVAVVVLAGLAGLAASLLPLSPRAGEPAAPAAAPPPPAPPAPPSPALSQGRFGKGIDGRALTADILYRPEYDRSPFAVELWARLEGQGTEQVLLACHSRTSEAHWEIFAQAGTGACGFRLGREEKVGSRVITDDEWHYLALVSDGKEMKLYVDAQLATLTRLVGAPPEGAGPLWLATYPARERPVCAGILDELRISRFARPIKATPTQPFLADAYTVGLWHLDTIENGKLADSTSTANAAVPHPRSLP